MRSSENLSGCTPMLTSCIWGIFRRTLGAINHANTRNTKWSGIDYQCLWQEHPQKDLDSGPYQIIQRLVKLFVSTNWSLNHTDKLNQQETRKITYCQQLPGQLLIFRQHGAFLFSHVQVETEELIYPWQSLVAEFGGALGLFLGFSFMTIWESLIEFKNFKLSINL